MSSRTRSKTGQGVNQEAEAEEGMESAVMVGATEVAIILENMERARRAEMDDRERIRQEELDRRDQMRRADQAAQEERWKMERDVMQQSFAKLFQMVGERDEEARQERKEDKRKEAIPKLSPMTDREDRLT